MVYIRKASFALVILMMAAIAPPMSVGDDSTFDPASMGVLWQNAGSHNATMWSVRWSPDASKIAATYFDNSTVIFEAKTGKMIVKLGSHPVPVSGGRCDGERTCTVQDHLPERVSAWSPDGRYLATGGDDRYIFIYNTTSWQVEKMLQGHRGSILTLDFSPDSKYIVSGSGTDKVGMNNVPDENEVRVWDVANGSLFRILGAHKDAVMEVSWAPDGKHIISVSDDKSMKYWSTETWTLAGELRGHTLGVLCADFSPDGGRLVTGSRDYTVRVWNLSNLAPVAKWDMPNCVRSVDYHPSGEMIAVSGVDETLLTIRNATTGVILTTFDDSAKTRSAVMSSRWSPDGRELAAGAGKEGTLRVYALGQSKPKPSPLFPAWVAPSFVYSIINWTGVVVIGLWGWRRMERDRR